MLLHAGQFGTRLQGGKDASSPRYIFTRLATPTRHAFNEADDPLLHYLNEEGQDIEPVWCVNATERMPAAQLREAGVITKPSSPDGFLNLGHGRSFHMRMGTTAMPCMWLAALHTQCLVSRYAYVILAWMQVHADPADGAGQWGGGHRHRLEHVHPQLQPARCGRHLKRYLAGEALEPMQPWCG